MIGVGKVVSVSAFLTLNTLCLVLLPAYAALNIGGRTYDDRSFADSLGPIDGNLHSRVDFPISNATDTISIEEAVTGSDLLTAAFCGLDAGIETCFITLHFDDNLIVNDPGIDFTVFELGGAFETFDVVIGETAVAGSVAFTDSNGNGGIVYGVDFDLDDFGVAPGGSITSLRIDLFDDGPTASSEIGAVAALNFVDPNCSSEPFFKVADTNTLIPGTAIPFARFTEPALNGTKVAFWGTDGQHPNVATAGIFRSSCGGAVEFVAQAHVTVIPDAPLVNGEPQTLDNLGDPWISNGQIVFWGQNPSSPVYPGIYLFSNGAMSRIADIQTNIPDGEGQFGVNGFGGPGINGLVSIDNGMVVFVGGDLNAATQEGLYLSTGGQLQRVADRNTLVPDSSGDLFTDFSLNFNIPPVIANGTVVFQAQGASGQTGLYTNANGPLETVVDSSTYPGIVAHSFDGTDTVFITSQSSFDQLWRTNGAGFELVTAEGLIADASVGVSALRSPAISNGNIAFLGTSSSTAALFAHYGGSLFKVLDTNDQLDGKNIFSFDLSTGGLSGNQLAFRVRFNDEGSFSEGIYIANLAVLAQSADSDLDGHQNSIDNCTLVANESQCDSDADGYGNRCDGDMNNNGATNSQDYVLFRQELGTVMADPYTQADINCNGVANSQDYVLFRQLLGSPPGPSGLVP